MNIQDIWTKIKNFFKKGWTLLIIPIGALIIRLLFGSSKDKLEVEIKEQSKQIKDLGSDIEDANKSVEDKESEVLNKIEEVESISKPTERDLIKKILPGERSND